MNTEIIKAADNKNETMWLLTATGLLLAICALLIIARQRTPAVQTIRENQISVFNDLNSNEQGIYNDLLSAVEEIEMIHEEKGETEWPTVNELEEEWISPFVQDSVREIRGGLNWIQSIAGSDIQGKEKICAYTGRPEDPDKAGAFLLLIYSDHEGDEGYRIWYNPEGNTPPPTSFREKSLILDGWLEAVPYTGEEELKRLKG